MINMIMLTHFPAPRRPRPGIRSTCHRPVQPQSGHNPPSVDIEPPQPGSASRERRLSGMDDRLAGQGGGPAGGNAAIL